MVWAFQKEGFRESWAGLGELGVVAAGRPSVSRGGTENKRTLTGCYGSMSPAGLIPKKQVQEREAKQLHGQRSLCPTSFFDVRYFIS